MAAAVYRARSGAEFVIEYVPRGFTPPKLIVVPLENGKGTRQFRYVGDGKCDKFICHGPGHQSTSRCENLGTHDEHKVEGGYGTMYWKDSDMRPTPTGPNWGTMAERYGPMIAYER